MATADIDNDLDLDLVVTDFLDRTVSVLLNNGDGTFASRSAFQAGVGPHTIMIGDLDGDLDCDLAVTDVYNDNVSILLNDCVKSLVKIVPDTVTILRGLQIGGMLSDLFLSDDVRMRFWPGFVVNSNEAPVWLIFDASLPNDSPAILSFTTEAQAGTPGLTTTTEVFNWTANGYDVLDVSQTMFNNDAVLTLDLTSGIADYVQAGSKAVRSRVGWRKTGFTFNFPWEVRVDQIIWTAQ